MNAGKNTCVKLKLAKYRTILYRYESSQGLHWEMLIQNQLNMEKNLKIPVMAEYPEFFTQILKHNQNK